MKSFLKNALVVGGLVMGFGAVARAQGSDDAACNPSIKINRVTFRGQVSNLPGADDQIAVNFTAANASPECQLRLTALTFNLSVVRVGGHVDTATKSIGGSVGTHELIILVKRAVTERAPKSFLLNAKAVAEATGQDTLEDNF